jgi:hypothetical protein
VLRRLQIAILSLGLGAAYTSHAELGLVKKIKERRQKKRIENEWKHQDLLREVPLDVGSYALPEQFGSAGELFLEFRRIPADAWLVKMEALRRGFLSLDSQESDHFVELVKAQYQTNADDTTWIFFHAYTQLLFKDHVLSVRLMKIAEERLHNSITAFAYALALANADIREGGRSDQFNERKMKAVWSLLDAAQRNSTSKDPRVTESLNRVAQHLMDSSVAYKTSLADWTPSRERQPASKN